MNRLINAALVALVAASPVLSSDAFAQDSITVETAGETTPREKLNYVNSVVAEMDSILKNKDRLAERAAKSGAAENVECVEESMNTVQLLRSVSAQAQAKLTEALAANNEQLAEHEFRKVVVAAARAREMQNEANTCAGEDAVLAGDLSVDVQNDALAEGDDTSALIGMDALVGDVNPPQGSPFQ